ncbi:TIGR02285 family protein [Pseudoduganella sp. LjRoot289]|uniref:TIGR02285 family protein n=1 Tax=Pseudoduganella sp. LjRoot289 TaxID=3342314 RepID=UPI003ECC7746
MPRSFVLPFCPLAAVLAAAASHAGAAAAQPEITWYLYDLAPLVITDGPRKGEGFIEMGLRHQLLPALPEYRHKIVVVPIQRIALMLKTERAACSPGLIRNPEREQFMVFSAPTLAAIPAGAFVRRGEAARVAPYVNAKGKLVLDKLLADGQVSLGIDAARSYGGPVDTVLRPYKDQPRLFGLSTPEAARSLVQMLLAKRVDAILGQPFEVPYYLGLRNVDDIKALRFYPLAEQADAAVNHVACSNSAQGLAVVEKVNAVLARPGVREAMAVHYLAWLDEDARKLAEHLRRAVAGAKP